MATSTIMTVWNDVMDDELLCLLGDEDELLLVLEVGSDVAYIGGST